MARKPSMAQQVAEAEKKAQYWEGRYESLYEEHQSLKKEVEAKRQGEIGSYNHELARANNINEQMMEIVRWHVNPKTAEDSNKFECPRCGTPNRKGRSRCTNCGNYFN